MNERERTTRQTYETHSESWTARVRTGMNWAHEHIEKPAMRRLLPSLAGCDVLLAGCGSGEEAGPIMASHPASVAGIDLSPSLVGAAAAAFPTGEFSTMSFDDLQFDDNSFDLIYSSLALHYSDHLDKTLEGFRRVLRPGGQLLFSIHHPMLWSSATERGDGYSRRQMGYLRDSVKGVVRVDGDYHDARWISDTWFGDMPVQYFHQPLAKTIMDIMGARFSISEMEEPTPVTGDGPDYEIYTRLPLFLVFLCRAD